MKKLVLFSILSVLMLFSVSVTAVTVDYFAPGSVASIINLSTLPAWLSEHWVSVSLIVSEVAALSSGKWSGILKSVVNLGNIIFRKKK